MAFHFFKKTVVGYGASGSYDNFDLMWYDWVTFMTQYNFALVGSSDGSTFSTTDGSKLTASSNYTNATNWLVLKCNIAGYNRQYLINKYSQNVTRRMFYSKQGFSMSNPGYLGSNISATNPPQALDAVPIDAVVTTPYTAMTSGYSPTLMLSINITQYSEWNYMFFVDDVTGSWYILGNTNQDSIQFIIGCDVLAESDTADQDPSVLITVFGNSGTATVATIFPSAQTMASTSSGPFKAWGNRPAFISALSDTQTAALNNAKRIGPYACIGNNYLSTQSISNYTQMPSSLTGSISYKKDPTNGYLQLLPVYYSYMVTTSSAFPAIKGKSSLFYLPTNYKYNNAAVSTTNHIRDYYIISSNANTHYPWLVIPWDGSSS
jgi:hypothetical protein